MALEPEGWSSRTLRVWGKSDPDSGSWMPLVQHLEDAAAVAGYLWDEWLPTSTRQAIAQPLTRGEEDGRTLVTWMAGLHDLGKASPAFQTKICWRGQFESVLDDLDAAGLVTPRIPPTNELPMHGLVGEYLLAQWLQETYGVRPRVAHSWFSAVGAHHGTAPGPRDFEHLEAFAADPSNRRAVTPTAEWREVQREIIEAVSRRTGAADRLEEWVRRGRLPVTMQALVAGVVVVADWLASDTGRFQYLCGEAGDRLASACLGEDLPRPWVPRPAGHASLLARRFPGVEGNARPIQVAAVQYAADCSEPPLIVVEAGTGEGKTEAALMAAEVLAERFGQGGVVFALPTQATTDGIFPRLLSWVDRLDLPGPASVFLAHGKAGLNEEFEQLLHPVRVRSVCDEDGSGDSVHEVAQAVVTSWLRGRRRGILSSFVAATVDQVLFGALKARHLPLRHLALAGKVVVVDEVHAADDFMRVYLTRFLEWLGAYGTPVVLLSATLPPAVRDELVAAYRQGAGAEFGGATGVTPDSSMSEAYPRLTVATRQIADTVHVEGEGQPDRAVTVTLVGEEWLDEVVAAVRAGACVAVIQNTVTRVQEAARRLRAVLGRERVSIVHAQLLAIHRAVREREIREWLGPPRTGSSKNSRPHGLVVCGTQVLEQSLDIDVDLMVTDIAPVDLVLQRAGRLHRHRRPARARPDECRVARLLISGARVTPEGPLIESGSAAVYGRYRLLRSLEALTPHLKGVALRLPSDTPTLVTHGYDPSVRSPDAWSDMWREAKTEHESRIAAQRQTAGAFVLAPVEEHADLTEFSQSMASDPDGRQGARARVRDTEDSVEVIVVREGPDGLHPLEGTEIDPATVLPDSLEPPRPHVARRLLRCTLRLPRRLCGPRNIDTTIRSLEEAGRRFEGWRRSPWLEGELVLVLDEQLRGCVAGVPVRYSMDDGLVVGQTGGDDNA